MLRAMSQVTVGADPHRRRAAYSVDTTKAVEQVAARVRHHGDPGRSPTPASTGR